jgi:Flp pilus assembly protein TadD
MKKRTTCCIVLAALLWNVTFLQAQTVQEGMSHLYGGRIKNAIETFEKILAANPNSIEAHYWLGQSKLETDQIMSSRIAEARQVYDKALQATNGAPLIRVGLGHVDLLSGKVDDARQHFETALTTTRTRKGNDPGIATAIGRAITDAKGADYKYAVRLLEEATTLDPKNTEALLQLGNAHRKAGEGQGGGSAFQAYNKALEVNPSFAAASFRLAKLFESQRNWELFLNYLNDAVKKDPKFTLAYYELFYYYFYRSKFTEAEEQLNQYIASKMPDTDVQDQFLYAQLCWAKKDFNCATTKAESVVSALGALTKPKVYRLLADAYYNHGDLAQAKKYSDLFFLKKNPDDYTSYDHKLRADILSKTDGTPDEVASNYMLGAQLDTLLSSKIDFLKQGAEFFKARGDSISRIKEGDLRLEILKMRGANAGQRELFDAGFAYYQGKHYEKADSIFDVYSARFPDEVYGPMMQYNIHRARDTSMEKGAAVPWAERYLVILEKDTTKNKKNIIGVSSYLASYYANVAKDRDKALVYLRKMLALDPSNTVIQQNISILEKVQAPGTTPPSPKPGQAPARSGKPAAKGKSVLRPPLRAAT